MAAIVLVHLSDLHLGNDFVWRALLGRRSWWNTEDKDLLTNLAAAIRSVDPDYVVVTGDIVNKCRRRTFAHAVTVLQRLFQAAGVDVQEKVLVIPGNHDVPVWPWPRKRRFFGRSYRFVCFLKELFNEPSYLKRTARFLHLDADRKLCFIGLDSTLKRLYQAAEGEVGQDQWVWLDRKCEWLMKSVSDFESFVKIVLLHHHPHGIVGSGGERFMQLLDQADAQSAFGRHRVNIVLHGHKHFPHDKSYPVETGGQYTVIAAGTATCPFAEEQATEGNSFNVIRLNPDSRLLTLERWKANNDKKYEPLWREPRRYQLFEASETGYRMRTSRTVARIEDMAGTCVVTTERLGLVVDREDELKWITFEVGSASACCAIGELDYDKDDIEDVQYTVNELRRREGRFIFRRPLRWGSAPIDIWHSYEATRAICMRRGELDQFYPGEKREKESVGMRVVRPCDELWVSVELPRGSSANPKPRVLDSNQAELDVNNLSHRFVPDPIARRYSLIVRNPKLYHKYSLSWQVVDP